MSQIAVHLFGRLTIACDGRPVTGIDGEKVQELLSYLLLFGLKPHKREKLATLLWPERPPVQSRRYLSKALWQIQAALDAFLPPQIPRLFTVEQEWIQLSRDAPLSLDVATFEAAYEVVRGIPGRQLEAEAVQQAAEATRLYAGDLLEGWYQEWCLCERERLHHIYLTILDKLMSYHEGQRAYEEAQAYGYDILRCDMAREKTHRRLMRLLFLSGDRTGAIRQFEQCTAVLAEELGVSPSLRTLALYRLVTGKAAAPAAAETSSSSEKDAVDALALDLIQPLERLLHSVRNLETALSATEYDLLVQLEALEQQRGAGA